ncbi:hypothetical protein [Sulfurimonas sp.]|uniref:hypothetical protein n=1 Tax=Sulfurimonas sp. TaxID=2022749 RepID=UPI0026288D24|nr:hypothetical protein [Sulfurimonas sp.]MCW8894356.1 hypothetical protein [Sulfurimonas sp.]
MKKIGTEKRRPENAKLRRSIDKLLNDGALFMEKHLHHLEISDYRYDIQEAVVELDLDETVIHQLVEDYIIQILKSKITFYKHIQELKQAELHNIDIDYTKIRDLAHKNLGVVRNLRIKDARKILEIIMIEDDLDNLRLCVKALEISAIKLHPLCAYETINLIKIKNML